MTRSSERGVSAPDAVPEVDGRSGLNPSPADTSGAEDSLPSHPRKDGLLTTGDMARLSSNTLRTVRFYEEAGILHPVQRTDGRHRLFEYSELDKLRLVSELRAAGLSLEEIRDLLEVKQRADNGANASKDALARLERQIERMSQRIDILTKLRNDLHAARAVLAECQTCTKNRLYPDGCSTCHVMTDQPELPKTVSVVWSVARS